MVIGIAIVIPFTLGEALLGLEAYFIRDWKTLQVVAHLPLLCEDRVGRIGFLLLALYFQCCLVSTGWFLNQSGG